MPGNCGVSESLYIIKPKESIAADFFLSDSYGVQ